MSKEYAGTPPVPTYNIHSLLHRLGVYTVNHLEVCTRQLLQRGNPNTDTEEMFYAINKYFKEPREEESINIVKV